MSICCIVRENNENIYPSSLPSTFSQPENVIIIKMKLYKCACRVVNSMLRQIHIKQ